MNKPLVPIRTAHNMYRSVWAEMSSAQYYSEAAPKFSITKKTFHNESALAMTEFGDKYGNLLDHASAVLINGDAYPILDEEEVLYVIIHEVAHVIAGYWAQHYREWAMVMEEHAGIVVTYLAPRRRMEYMDQLPPWFNQYAHTRNLDEWFATV